MSQSRFTGKTYSRVKDKDKTASTAFDELFNSESKFQQTRTTATSQKWGKTTFTSVRDSRGPPSPDPKRRKVQQPPPQAPTSSDPFTFESSDEGGISPKKKVTSAARPTVPSIKIKVPVGKPGERAFPIVVASSQDSDSTNSSQETRNQEFRPVKRFFRTHKGFLEKPDKPTPAPAPVQQKLRTIVKKKPTSDKSPEDAITISSQDSSTSGIYLSSSAATKSDDGLARDRSAFLSPSQGSDTSSAASFSQLLTQIPSKTNIPSDKRVDDSNYKLSPPTSPVKRREILGSGTVSPSKARRKARATSPNSQDSGASSLGARTLSDAAESQTSMRVTRGPPRLVKSHLTNPQASDLKNRCETPSPPTLNPATDKTEIRLEDGEFVFNDDDLVVIRGSSDSPALANAGSGTDQNREAQKTANDDEAPASSQDSVKSGCDTPPLSQDENRNSPSGMGRRLLLKKHLTDSPAKSPAKRYNPRQWIKEVSPPEKPTMSRASSLPSTQSSQSQATSAATFDFDDNSPLPSLTRQPKAHARLGVDANNKNEVTAVKVQRDYKELYTVVQNVKDVHECQEHGETQEFQDDIAYLLDGLNDTQTVTTRCLSTLSLANKCIEPVFRMHLRAHGTVTRIFTALKDACHNPCLAMSTSLIMFMLSRDRLSVDVDQDGMEMMINLLNADARHKKMKPGMAKDFQRIKQRVQEVIAQLKKDGGAKNMELSEISTSNLATETLLALSSRRSGDAFKEEMRTLGGLDHIVDMVAECTDGIDDEDIEGLSDALLDTLKKIDRCLRVLENVTYLNSDNQDYLISYETSSLINSLCNLLRITKQTIQTYPAPAPEVPEDTNEKDDKSKKNDNEKKAAVPLHPSHLVFNCLLSIMRVLLNITHDNVWGSQKVGQTEGLMDVALLCILQVPQYAPHSERFDLLVLGLGMMINLVEHCEMNRRLLMNTETVAYYDSQEDQDGQKEAIEALTLLFLQKESAAGQLEESVMTAPGTKAVKDKTENDENKDKSLVPAKPNESADESGQWQESDSGLLWVIGKKKKIKSGGNKNDDDESDDEEQHIEIIPSSVEDEENFTKALHKAGKHMEDSIVAAYTALLLGCLIKENPVIVEKVREFLPDGSFDPMVNILTKFLGFMNLTSGVAAQHSSKSIVEIIQIMDKL